MGDLEKLDGENGVFCEGGLFLFGSILNFGRGGALNFSIIIQEFPLDNNSHSREVEISEAFFKAHGM
mgnify:CR=1 FL=1